MHGSQDAVTHLWKWDIWGKKKGYFCSQQIPLVFILWIYKLAFEPVHIHLPHPALRNMEFTY